MVSNQEQALENIITLGIINPSLREILRTEASTTILQLQRMSSAWSQEYGTVNVKAFRALTVLNDSEIYSFVDAASFCEDRTRRELFLPKLEEYLLYGLFGVKYHCHKLIDNLSDPNSSFLVLRIIIHRWRNSNIAWGRLMNRTMMLVCIGIIHIIPPVENATEWHTLDEMVVGVGAARQVLSLRYSHVHSM